VQRYNLGPVMGGVFHMIVYGVWVAIRSLKGINRQCWTSGLHLQTLAVVMYL
jgi:hypothetical protein